MFSFYKYKDSIISFAIVSLIIFFAIELAGGTAFFQDIPAVADRTYTLVDGPDETANFSLQLKTLVFTQSGCNPGYLASGEPYILYSASPSPNEIAGPGEKIKLWYSDEHALILGDGNVSPMKKHPSDTVTSPQVGNIAKRDTQGFPLFPALFLTDVTNDPTSMSGDAQNGGTPIPPDIIYGTWKAAGGKDPTKNGWALPTGADPFPSQPIQLSNTTNRKIENQYGSEIIWTIDNLHLLTGHSYRAQFVVHDGDLNKDGGDIGIGCMTIHY